MTTVLFSARADLIPDWRAKLLHWGQALGVEFDLFTDPAEVAPGDVDVLVTGAAGGLTDFTPYADVKLIQSFWAGVEGFLSNPTFPAGPPLARMVEPGLREGMTDYICAHVLRHHINLDKHIADSAAATWEPTTPPLSQERRVGVLGLGALGADAAQMLAALRFDVAGWSRSPKEIAGVACHSGDAGLEAVIRRSEIIVTILPSTPSTRHVLNAERLAWAPKGAAIINPGRGALIDDEALLAALDAGHIAHATLDVFDIEPLPQDHPYWRRKDVTVTPHVAAETRIHTAAKVVVEQIARLQGGEPIRHIVDRQAGY